MCSVCYPNSESTVVGNSETAEDPNCNETFATLEERKARYPNCNETFATLEERKASYR